VPFIQKFGVNPVTGAPLSLKQLTALHFHKNDKGALTVIFFSFFLFFFLF